MVFFEVTEKKESRRKWADRGHFKRQNRVWILCTFYTKCILEQLTGSSHPQYNFAFLLKQDTQTMWLWLRCGVALKYLLARNWSPNCPAVCERLIKPLVEQAAVGSFWKQFSGVTWLVMMTRNTLYKNHSSFTRLYWMGMHLFIWWH